MPYHAAKLEKDHLIQAFIILGHNRPKIAPFAYREKIFTWVIFINLSPFMLQSLKKIVNADPEILSYRNQP